MEKPKKHKNQYFQTYGACPRSIVLKILFFLGFFGFSIGFTTILLVFIGFPIEKPTFAKKNNLSVQPWAPGTGTD